MCFLRHAERHARNRTSLAGLEQDLLFFGPPHIMTLAILTPSFKPKHMTVPDLKSVAFFASSVYPHG